MSRRPRRSHSKQPEVKRRGWPRSPDGEFDMFGFLIDLCEELETLGRQAKLSDYQRAVRASAYINGLDDEPLAEIEEREKFTPPVTKRRKKRKK